MPPKQGSRRGSKEDTTPAAAAKPKKVEAPVLSEEEQKLMAATTEALNQLIEQGKDVASELKEAEEMNLPRLAQRGRRKSRDLEQQAMDLMGSQLEKVFKMMDVSGDGNLDEGELMRAYELAGRPASEESIKKAIKMLDKDNDGLINLEEFKAIAWQTSIEDQDGGRAAAAAAAREVPEDD